MQKYSGLGYPRLCYWTTPFSLMHVCMCKCVVCVMYGTIAMYHVHVCVHMWTANRLTGELHNHGIKK